MDEQNNEAPAQASGVAYVDFQEMGTDAQLAALYTALAEASGGYAAIKKNRTVTIETKNKDGSRGRPYTFTYAELETVIDATRPALSKCGLSVLQPFTMAPNQAAIVRTILAHKDGGRIMSISELPSWGDIKGLGGNLTYLRRYAYNALLCLAADQDADEGPTEKERGEDVGPARSPQVPAQAKPAAAPATKAAAAPKETSSPGSLPGSTKPQETTGTPEYKQSLNSSTNTPSPAQPAATPDAEKPTPEQQAVLAKVMADVGCTQTHQVRTKLAAILGEGQRVKPNFKKTIVALVSEKWSEQAGISLAQIDQWIGDAEITSELLKQLHVELGQAAIKKMEGQ